MKTKTISIISIFLIFLIIILWTFRSNLKMLFPDHYKTYLEIRKVLNGQNNNEKIDTFYYGIANAMNKPYIIGENKVVDDIEFTSFSLPKIFPSKAGGGAINSGYIDFYDDKLFYASASGVFALIDHNEDTMSLDFINSNITDIIFNKMFFTESKFGIKDILINEGYLYITLTKLKETALNIAVYRAPLSKENLVFEPFFIPDEFIKPNNENNSLDQINAHQSGGRIVEGRKDSLILSLGEFRSRLLAQDDNSVNGKIISISKKTNKYRIISKGHRNPQGLFYDSSHDILISTEHGPSGGDEINLNLDLNKIKNYGWPISSYGYHYSFDEDTDDHSKSNRFIEGAPLYKSHEEFGFVEPIYFFKENPGISQIIISKINNSDIEFFAGSLGWPSLKDSDRPYLRSLIFFNYNISSKKINLRKSINLGERIRDIIYNESSGSIYILGETNGNIYFFKNLNSIY